MKPQATDNHQNALRAIGQGLETLEVKSFDLEISDKQYVVSGECDKPTAADAPKSNLKKIFLSLVLNVTKKSAIQTSGSPPFHFTGLRFTRKDIELLERKGQVLQTQSESRTPKPHSLSQILRTVGAYLDQERSRLVKISWRDGFLTLWYINRSGVESKDILSPMAFYQQWVDQYKHRKPVQPLKRTGND